MQLTLLAVFFDIHKILNSFPEHEIDKAFEQIKVKAINMNAKHQTQKNAEYKPEDFRNDYLSKLINDARLIEALVEQWSKNKQDKKRDAFIKEIESQFLNKKNNPTQKTGKNPATQFIKHELILLGITIAWFVVITIIIVVINIVTDPTLVLSFGIPPDTSIGNILVKLIAVPCSLLNAIRPVLIIFAVPVLV